MKKKIMAFLFGESFGTWMYYPKTKIENNHDPKFIKNSIYPNGWIPEEPGKATILPFNDAFGQIDQLLHPQFYK